MADIKILSIDLDIIFEPCIQLYNQDINDAPKGRIWDMLYNVKDIERHLSFNTSIYQSLFSNLQNMKNYENIKGIYVGENHSSIIKMCDSIYKENNSKFNVINIDHHHDICYSPNQHEDAYVYNTCGCGSWVIYLESKNVLSQYTWLGNYNSKEYDCHPLKVPYYKEKFEMCLDELPEILKDIDYLYITTSDKWCPPKFRSVIDNLLINLYTSNVKIINYGHEISHPDNAPQDYFQ